MSEPLSLLSPRGEQRRERILALAIAASRGRRRRRLLTRAALVAILVAAIVPQLRRSHPPRKSDIAVKLIERPPAQAVLSPPLVTRIETDPHIIQRLAIPPRPPHVIVIDDRELLTDLALADRPAGLAYVNGKATLLFR